MKRTQNGFTLIEMLVVCLIVVLLAGIVFRMVGAMGRADDIAKTKAKLEMVANALEEFKSIYGKYPPVPLYKTDRGTMPMFCYEFPWDKTYGPDLTAWKDAARRMKRENGGKRSDWSYGPGDGTGDAVFTFGLCSFFVPRVTGTAGNVPPFISDEYKFEQWSAFNTGNESGDSQRDLDAVRRILPHLGESLGPNNEVVGLMARHNPGILSAPWQRYKRLGGAKTNDFITINDQWDHELLYYSVPPYETYKLWSSGPDGLTVGDKCRNAGHADIHKGATGSDWAGRFWRIADGDPETEDDLVAGEN